MIIRSADEVWGHYPRLEGGAAGGADLGALQIWAYVAEITDEFILLVDVQRTYIASVNEGRHALALDREDVSLLIPGTRPRSFYLTMTSNEVKPAQCERVVTARLEGPLKGTA